MTGKVRGHHATSTRDQRNGTVSGFGRREQASLAQLGLPYRLQEVRGHSKFVQRAASPLWPAEEASSSSR